MESEYILSSSTTKSSAQKSSTARSPGGLSLSAFEASLAAGSPSHANRSGGGAVDDLRADSDEKAWLQKSNFDLKMKVYYLEARHGRPVL